MRISVEDRPASVSVPGVTGVAYKAAIEVDNTAVPPITVRVPEVVAVTAVADIPSYTASKKNGGFGASEWMDEIDVMLTLLEADDIYDNETSQMSSSSTFYWNRDAKDGDLAGRVLVKQETTWVALFLNYNKLEPESIRLEYGAGMQTVLAYATLATTLTLAYAF